jgi:hypothetical protein
MYTSTKKSFNGFYFAITESVIFNIMNNLVVCGGDIVHRERGVAIYHYLRKFYHFEVPGSTPAFFFIP